MQLVSAYSITVPRADLTLDVEKRTGQFTVDVKNEQPALDRVVLDIVPVGAGAADPTWFSVDRHLRPIPPDGSEQFLVSVTVPASVAAGSFQIRPVAYSSDHPPEDTKVEGPPITVTLRAPTVPVTVPWWKRWFWPWWMIIAGALVLLAVAAVVFFVFFHKKPVVSPALRFDGTKVVTIPSTTPLPIATKFTVQATLTPTANPAATEGVIDVRRTDGGQAISASIIQGHLLVLVCPSSPSCRLVITKLAAGQKQVVTLTYDAATTRSITLYIDGVQKDDQTVAPGSDAQSLSPASWSIGGAGGGFNGDIDDVAVWNDALSSKQVRKSAGNPPTGPEQGLVALWRFNETADQQSVLDSSGNGHDGFLGTQPTPDPADPVRVHEPG